MLFSEWRAYFAGHSVHPAILGALVTGCSIGLLSETDRLKRWHLVIAVGLIIGFYLVEMGLPWYIGCASGVLASAGYHFLITWLVDRMERKFKRKIERLYKEGS